MPVNVTSKCTSLLLFTKQAVKQKFNFPICIWFGTVRCATFANNLKYGFLEKLFQKSASLSVDHFQSS